MAVSCQLSADKSELTIKIQGRFDFSAHQQFRDAYEKQGAEARSHVIEMKDTTYLDSSALGMLLLLRDFAGGDRANITIRNPNEAVRKILSISNFEQLFNILV